MGKCSISKRILLGITGDTFEDQKNKINEIKKLKIKKAALFLECLDNKEREEIYTVLLESKIKEIPFVHINNNMNKEELEFLQNKFKTKFFNFHENSFKHLKKIKGFEKKILLELNYDNKIQKSINLNKIGGFCIDLSHFKASEERKTEEYNFIMGYKKQKKLFIANHLNGYSEKIKKDRHKIKSLKQFNYLKTIPKFVFGRYIALEIENPIREQIKFKKHIIEILKDRF